MTILPMTRLAGDQTRVSVARSETVSVRTTIPSYIARQMELKAGDTLNWKLDKIGGEWVAMIRKKG